MARGTLTFHQLYNSAQPKPKMFTIEEASPLYKKAAEAWMQNHPLQDR
jgi:hypothetical protein